MTRLTDIQIIVGESSALGIKLEGYWCGAHMYTDDVVLVADSGAELQAMFHVIEAYTSW